MRACWRRFKRSDANLQRSRSSIASGERSPAPFASSASASGSVISMVVTTVTGACLRSPLLLVHPLPRPGPRPLAVPLGKPEHHQRRLPHQPAVHPQRHPRLKGAAVPLRGSLRRGYSSAHFATLTGILGLSGFTSTLCSWGRSTRSMSSIGIAPSSTSLPSTIAPVKQRRLRKRTSTGPT